MITSTPRGLFCEAGNFYIDPWEPVERALVTHAHSDHARPGSASYLCAAPGETVLRRRIPDGIVQTLPYGERITIGEVRVSFHPAGHILGSATRRFPEIVAAASHLPDGTVLDGEVLAFTEGKPMPFSALQQRIGREKQVAQIMRTVPVVFVAYDVLERDGVDVRTAPMSERRDALLQLTTGGVLRASEEVTAPTWEELARLREESRERGVEGFILKRRDSEYGVGRRKGAWWKWKIDPLTVDAVLIYAQPGNGRRASLLTDYTFGVWDQGALVPVAKAYSGLSNAEIEELDKWIRRHTRERHGPVRAVDPIQVFELGFQAIAPSTRHKSGIAVRFPRMLRWRKDKPAADADTLDSLRTLLNPLER